jgi:hypothetical protein
MTADIAPDCREGDPCPRCGRKVNVNRGAGCYLGRCSTLIACRRAPDPRSKARQILDRLGQPSLFDTSDLVRKKAIRETEPIQRVKRPAPAPHPSPDYFV